MAVYRFVSQNVTVEVISVRAGRMQVEVACSSANQGTDDERQRTQDGALVLGPYQYGYIYRDCYEHRLYGDGDNRQLGGEAVLLAEE